jgi:putative tryptophan/tyrosine transport system substrate-binding protein
MRRREFIAAFGGAALAPFAARAQQPKLPTVGMLGAGTPTSHGKWIDGLVARLLELGWTDGDNVRIAYRWAEGSDERTAEIAAEFVRQNVDVIVTSGNQAVKTVMRTTAQVPIIAAAMTDPVPQGIVASLAQPGGNVTGLSIQTDELVGKRFELLHEVVPGLRRIAVMGYEPAPGFPLEVAAAKAAAPRLGVEITVVGLQQAGDIAPAFASLKGKVQGLYVAITPFTTMNKDQINARALDARIPTMHGLTDYVRGGGLMSYGADLSDSFRHAGDFVDRVLRGAKPAMLPVEQPTKFDLVINLKTAKVLGLAIPPMLLARADEVIE